ERRARLPVLVGRSGPKIKRAGAGGVVDEQVRDAGDLDLAGPGSAGGSVVDVVTTAGVDLDGGELRCEREDEVQVVAVGGARPAPIETCEAGDDRVEVVEVGGDLVEQRAQPPRGRHQPL